MRRAILGLAAGLAACGGAGDEGAPAGNRARLAPTAPVSAGAYVALASTGDRFEIESARLALQKAENAEVRGLAQMILSDHERSTAQLAGAAVEAGSPIGGAPVLSPAQRSNIEALRAAPRAAFDAEWLHQQVVAHQQALDAAAAYARGGESAPLRRHAAATIAAIQTHLIRARRLESETLARAQQQP
jgi:putative membrane protein